jgi:hypothetical protein
MLGSNGAQHFAAQDVSCLRYCGRSILRLRIPSEDSERGRSSVAARRDAPLRKRFRALV